MKDKTCVLIIDDEKGIRDASERILSRMGYHALKASCGEDGLNIVNKEKVAIVLLDMKMPGMDGLEVLQRLKVIDENILVIVITGFATVETAIKAMKQGAYDFIPKPFEPDQLRIVVNRASEKIRLSLEADKLEIDRQRTLNDLHTEQSRTRTIINALPNGVLVTNSEGQVVLVNPAFLRHMGVDEGKGPGEKIESYVKDQGFCDLALEISQGQHLETETVPTYEFNVKDKKYLLARGRPVLNEKNECLGAVMNLVDITAIKVLDRLKSEFVAKVSHELRSPLSTIHEQLAVVLEDMVQRESSEDKYLLSRAKEKTQGLISLIGDLLDLSRIESGSSFGKTEPVCIAGLLKDIVEFLKSKSDSKNQTLALKVCQDHIPKIVADPISLESVFGNLIANAINYTQEGGTIKVNVALVGTSVKVSVQDNGFGIEKKYLGCIFEKFYRVKNDKTRFITGTGLGLPIVKNIVEELKGSIMVESKPGTGTTFTVLLPVEKNK